MSTWQEAKTFSKSDSITELYTIDQIFQARQEHLNNKITEVRNKNSEAKNKLNPVKDKVEKVTKNLSEFLKAVNVPFSLDSSQSPIYDYSKNFLSLVPQIALLEENKAPKDSIIVSNDTGLLNYQLKSVPSQDTTNKIQSIHIFEDRGVEKPSFDGRLIMSSLETQNNNQEKVNLWTPRFLEENKKQELFTSDNQLNVTLENKTDIKIKKGVYLIEGYSLSIGHRTFECRFAKKTAHFLEKSKECLYGISTRNTSMPYSIKSEWRKKYDLDVLSLFQCLREEDFNPNPTEPYPLIKELDFISSISHVYGLLTPDMFDGLDSQIWQFQMHLSNEDYQYIPNSVTDFKEIKQFNGGIGQYLSSPDSPNNSVFSQLKITQMSYDATYFPKTRKL